MFVRDPRQSLDVCHVSGWITNAFTKDCPGILVDQFFNGIGVIRFRKPATDSLLRQDVRE